MSGALQSRPKLQTLIFETTRRCNHACRYCYNFWNPAEGEVGVQSLESGEADPGRAIALLEKALAETDCRHVTLTGGEPLLWKGLPEVLRYLQKRETSATVITNGHLLTEPMAASLVDLGVGLFEVPLLSHRRDVHDSLTGVPGSFDAVVAGMANLRGRRAPFVVVFVATRANIADLPGAIRLAFAFGARGLMFNRFNPGGRGRGEIEDLLPTLDQVRRALDQAEEASAEYRFPISCSIPIQPCLVDTSAYRHLTFGYCAAGSERAYFTFDSSGAVRPCNHTPTVLGNLWQQPFAEIITSPRLAAFQKAIPTFCRDCSRAMECQGGCKASAEVCYGSLEAEEPFLAANKTGCRNIPVIPF